MEMRYCSAAILVPSIVKGVVNRPISWKLARAMEWDLNLVHLSVKISLTCEDGMKQAVQYRKCRSTK